MHSVHITDKLLAKLFDDSDPVTSCAWTAVIENLHGVTSFNTHLLHIC